MANKNHTSHNQSYKVHKNGIKKPRKHRHTSTKEDDTRECGWLYREDSPAIRVSDDII